MSEFPPPPTRRIAVDPAYAEFRVVPVFGVVLGTLGLAALPIDLGQFLTEGWAYSPSGHAGLSGWALISTLIMLGLAGLLLLSSLGAYHFTRRGRDGMVIWAGSTLAYGVFGVAFWGRFLFYSRYPQYANLVGPDQATGLLAWGIGSLFAAVTLWHFARPGVRDAFRRDCPFTHEPPPPNDTATQGDAR